MKSDLTKLLSLVEKPGLLWVIGTYSPGLKIIPVLSRRGAVINDWDYSIKDVAGDGRPRG